MYDNETTAEQELILLCCEIAAYDEDAPDNLLDRLEHLIWVVRSERQGVDFHAQT